MLMEEYGGPERCLATITATILEKDSAVMTEVGNNPQMGLFYFLYYIIIIFKISLFR